MSGLPPFCLPPFAAHWTAVVTKTSQNKCEISVTDMLVIACWWYSLCVLADRRLRKEHARGSASEGKNPKYVKTPRRVVRRLVGVSRGNTIRGNRTERFCEGNLPLRGSLRGSLRGRVSEVFRGFQRVWEGLRGFERFLEVFRGFQRFFKDPLRDPLRVPFSSQSCRSCCP